MAERTNSVGPVTYCLCGDVMTGRGIDQILPHPCDPRLFEPGVGSALEYVELAEGANGPIPRNAPFDYIWGDALGTLRRADLCIVNLETAVTAGGDHVPKEINYRMNPGNVPCLNAAGIDCCVLANNHVLDWGVTGLLDTLETLTRAELPFAGAGRTENEAQAPAVLDVPGKGRVLAFAFGATTSGIPWDWAAKGDMPGVNLLPDLSRDTVGAVARKVAQYKRAGDIALASIHWGGNWGYAVPDRQTRFARALIDAAGIDVVHGHSSHHPRAIEIYKGKPILYGCGDFLNDYEGISGYEEFRDDLVPAYLLEVDPAHGRLAALTLAPFRIANFRLRRPSQSETEWLRDVMARECSRFGTRVALGEDGWLSVVTQ